MNSTRINQTSTTARRFRTPGPITLASILRSASVTVTAQPHIAETTIDVKPLNFECQKDIQAAKDVNISYNAHGKTVHIKDSGPSNSTSVRCTCSRCSSNGNYGSNAHFGNNYFGDVFFSNGTMHVHNGMGVTGSVGGRRVYQNIGRVYQNVGQVNNDRTFVMGGSSGQYVVNCIVPAHSSLSMRSESGDLDVAGPVNNLESSSGSGSISANEVVYANINTGSGTISIDECTGDGSLSAGSGTISVDHCSGHVSASTGSGNVHLGTLEGDVELTTGSGSVSVHKAMSGTIIASAGTGSIRIGVARGAQVIKSRGTITSMYPVSDTLGDPVAGAPGSGNTVRLHQVYTGLGRIKLVRS